MARSVKHREQHWEKKRKIEKRKKHIAARTINQQNGNVTSGQNGNAVKTQNGRPAGPERGDTTLSKLSTLSADPEDNLAEELAEDAGHGVSKSGKAIAKAPMDFTLALAQGFHNAPRLYGDETVRRPTRISGFHSGLRAGRDEFLYGIYDGVTGLYTQPYHGARDAGALGFLQGIPIGIGGLVLKSISATIGPPAYTMKGLYEEMHKKNQPTAFLRKARIIQGQKELALLGRGPLGEPFKRDGDEGDVKEEREVVERAVSLGWDQQLERTLVEQRERKSGMRGKLGLKGKSNKSTVNVSKKSSKESMEDTPKKASSTPIQESGNGEEVKRGRERGITAPETAMAWKERNNKGMAAPVKFQEEARLAGAGMNGAPAHFPRPGQVDAADGMDKENKPGAEMRGRAASDTIDWATIKKGEKSNEVASTN